MEGERSIKPLFNVQERKKEMMLINPYRFASAGLLLDTYTGAAAAYSLRKLRTAYTGYCIEVRRSSDDTTQNIGFTSGGVLDESSLTTFCGAGDGFVKTWYDQSGNSINVGQTTTSLQPQLVSGGTILKLNNKAGIYFTNHVLTNLSLGIYNQPNTYYIVCGINSGNTSSNTLIDGKGGNRNIINWNNTTWRIFAGSFANDGTQAAGNQSLIFALFNSSASILSYNNSESTNLNANTYPLGTCLYIGRYGDSPLKGYMQELIFFNSDKSSDRASIKTNINTFYSIY